jgi:hypothetical protein
LRKSIFDSETTKDHIIGLINYLCEFLYNRYQVEVPKEIRGDVVDKVLAHYKLHIDTYNVPVNGIDPYKFLSWSGLYLYELTMHNEELSDLILKSTIIIMNRTLVEEGRILPKLFLQKIFNMVKSEYRGKDSLGLGKNGLYLTFRSASLCQFEDTKFDIHPEKK